MPLWRNPATTLLALLSLALTPLAASADETWHPGLDLGGGLLYTHMEEHVDGQTLVTEKGFLPQEHARFFLRSQQLEIGIAVQDATGTIDYAGQAQNNQTLAVTPFNTQTNTTFLGLQLDATVILESLRLGVFAGSNNWQRGVIGKGGVSGGDEDYRWLALGATAAYRIPVQGKLALVPQLDLWRNSRVRQAAQSGSYDTAHLEPVGRGAGRFSLALAYTLQPHAEVRVRPFIQTFTFGESAAVPATRGGQPVLINGQPTVLFQPKIHYVQGGIDVEAEVTF